MIHKAGICVALVAVFAFGSVGRADELQQMSPDIAQLYAQHLTELFEKEIKERQVKFEVDPAQATGLHDEQDGILIVPIKGLKEGKIDPAVETELGAGLCYLFMSPCYAPLADGKPIDATKLRRLKFKDANGNERETVCLVVTVKHVADSDWRLFAFGAEKSPVINSTFGESSGSSDKPLAIGVSGAKEKKANLAFTLYKKYGASFAIGLK